MLLRLLFLALIVIWFIEPLPRASAASCGGLNQRSCGLTEGTARCRPGLELRDRRCKRPRKLPGTLTCGGRNLRPCRRDEHAPPCDRGLVIVRGKCVVPKPE